MTVQNPRILVVGDTTVEQTVKVDAFPEINAVSEAEGCDCLPGGKGTYASVAVARLGGDAVLCTAIGDDTYATDLVDYFKAEGVDPRFAVMKRGSSTAVDMLIKSGDGSRMISYRGALDKLSPPEVEEAYVSYPDGVILHGRLPSQAIDEAVKQSAQQNIPLFVASLPDPAKYPLSQIGGCEILVVNSAEAYRCTGIRPADQEKCMRACIALSQRIKAKYVIIRLEERGSFLFDGTFYNFFPALDVPDIAGVSTDDIFSSALVLEYLKSGGNIKYACEMAAVVGALYMTRGGGLRAFPGLEDVKRFMARNGIKLEY